MVDVLNTILQGLLPCRIVSDDFVAGSTNWRVKKYADGFCEIEGSKYFEGLALSSFVTGGVWVGDLELALPFSLKSLIGAWADGVVGYGKKSALRCYSRQRKGAYRGIPAGKRIWYRLNQSDRSLEITLERGCAA